MRSSEPGVGKSRRTVSIVVPAHNAAATIGATLQSIAPDRDLVREVLVVDDASCDGTGEVAVAIAEQCGLPLALIAANCRNAGAARNRGIERATGEFLFFLDADDELIEGGLAALVEALTRSGRSLAVGGSIRRSGAKLDDLKLPRGYGDDRRANVRNMLTLRLHPIIVGSALLRRSAVAGLRFAEGLRLDEDTCFWATVLSATDVVKVPRPVVLYHFDEARMAARYRASPIADFVMLAAAYTGLRAHGADRASVQWRKAWLSLSLARSALAEGRYELARRLLRPAFAHPEFRYGWKALRYRLRLHVGALIGRMRRRSPM